MGLGIDMERDELSEGSPGAHRDGGRAYGRLNVRAYNAVLL